MSAPAASAQQCGPRDANYRSGARTACAIIGPALQIWRRGVGPAAAGCVVEVFRAGNGFAEQRLRRRSIWLQGPQRDPLESHRAFALRARDRGRGGLGGGRRRALRGNRRPYRSIAQGQAYGRRRIDRKTVWWEGNRKITPENFQRLYDDFIAHARGKTLYAQDLYGGADPNYRIKTRVFTELAWHSLFIRQLLIRPVAPELEDFVPELTIVDLPSFKADPKRHGVRSDTVIAID